MISEKLMKRIVERVFPVSHVFTTPSINYWVYLTVPTIGRHDVDRLQDLLKAEGLRYYRVFCTNGKLVICIEMLR